MNRILAISDSPFWFTGYASQAREIMKRLALRPDFDVNYVAVGYQGQTMSYAQLEQWDTSTGKEIYTESLPFRIFPSPYPPREHIHFYGMMGAQVALNRFKDFKLVWFLADSFMMQWVINNPAIIKPTKLLVYFPSDGYPLPEGCDRVLKQADVVVAMAKDGKEQAEKQGIQNVHYIPHGVDTSIYTPLSFENKIRLREKWSQRLDVNLKNKFIVGWFGKNQPRKSLPEWLKVASEFSKGKEDNVIFLMHHDPEDPARGYDLNALAKKYGIDHLIKNTGLSSMQGFTPVEVNELYNICNVSLSVSSGEGFGICLSPNTEIITDKINKKIVDIKVGDKVLTHTGNFKNVTNIMKRKFEGNIYKIKVYGINKEIKITSEHPILAIKRPKKKFNKPADYVGSGANWIKASELKKGDCVAFPVIKGEVEYIIFDLKEFSSFKFDDNYIWHDMGYSGKSKYSYKFLEKEIGESKKVIENARKYLKLNLPPKTERQSIVMTYLNNLKFKEPEPKKYNRFIKLDENLAWVIGWYIAEGSSNGFCLEFSMNANEYYYACIINDIIKEKFGHEGKIIIKGNSLRLIISGEPICKFFSKICGSGARNKFIDKRILYGRIGYLEQVIEGLFLGDGHNNGTSNRLGTVSKNLHDNVLLALLRLNKKINSCKTKQGAYMISYNLNKKDISHSNKSWYNNTKEYLYTLIRDVKVEEYNGFVYNLEVDKDNSYTTEIGCVHNCSIEAMSAGTPMIITDFTSTDEIVPEGTGFKIPVERTMTGSYNVERAFADIMFAVDKLNYLYDHPEVISEMGAKAREHIVKNYDWSIVYPMWEKLIREVIEDSR